MRPGGALSGNGDTDRRRDLALGRAQAISGMRDELTAQLVTTIRGAFAAGASYEELEVETGLEMKTLRAIVRGGTLTDRATAGFASSPRRSRRAA